MDYFGLVKRAFQITIKNKYLWLFGFFVGASGGSMNFYNGGGGNTAGTRGINNYSYDQFTRDAGNFWSDHWTLITVIGLAILLIGLFFLVMRILSQGALIGNVNKIDQGKSSSIREGFGFGKKNFWRVLGAGILLGLVIMIALLVLGTPIALLFYYKMFLRGVILALIALVIFIPLSIVINYMGIYSYRYVVLKNKQVIESLKLGFNLFAKNIWQSIVFSLILMLVGIVVAIGSILVVIAIGIPFAIIGIIAFSLAQWIGAGIVIAIGILAFLVIMVVIGSAVATFQSSLWTLAFKELIKVKK